jgi:hypothetical protein
VLVSESVFSQDMVPLTSTLEYPRGDDEGNPPLSVSLYISCMWVLCMYI